MIDLLGNWVALLSAQHMVGVAILVCLPALAVYHLSAYVGCPLSAVPLPTRLVLNWLSLAIAVWAFLLVGRGVAKL